MTPKDSLTEESLQSYEKRILDSKKFFYIDFSYQNDKEDSI